MMKAKTLLHGGNFMKAIFLCCFCCPTNSRGCWVMYKIKKNIKHCKYMHNMQCSWLGIENFDMLVSIYKNWPNDSWVGTNVHGIVPRNGKNIDEGKWIQN
jgi:hypothetical protein